MLYCSNHFAEPDNSEWGEREETMCPLCFTHFGEILPAKREQEKHGFKKKKKEKRMLKKKQQYSTVIRSLKMKNIM